VGDVQIQETVNTASYQYHHWHDLRLGLRVFSGPTHLPPQIHDMSDPQGPSKSLFQSLFDAALEEYDKQTGTSLAHHPLAIKLDACNTVESINASLQEQAKAFRQFRGDDGKVTRCLKGVVHVLHKLSTTGVLGEGIGLVRRSSLTTSSKFRSLTTSAAVPACEGDIHGRQYPSLRMCPPHSCVRVSCDI